MRENCGPQPPSPPPNIKGNYGPQPPSPPPNIKGNYGPQPPSPSTNIRESYGSQPNSPPPHIKENCCPEPPFIPSNIKYYSGPQPAAPSPNIKEHSYLFPSSSPDNTEHYGHQPHSSSPSNKGYHDIKYTSFIPTNQENNGLVEPNNGGCFGPELPSILPYGRQLHDRQFITPASSKKPYEPHLPSPCHRHAHNPSSPLSNNFEYYTEKRQFSPLHNRGTSSFQDTSLDDATGSSLLQVSIIPSVSFSIQDTAHLGWPGAALENPLALARNVPYFSGDIWGRTLKP
jgi:hypothetical protein